MVSEEYQRISMMIHRKRIIIHVMRHNMVNKYEHSFTLSNNIKELLGDSTQMISISISSGYVGESFMICSCYGLKNSEQ